MTVKRTRELLGKKVAHFSDKQLLELNNQTSIFCDAFLDFILKDNFSKEKSIKPSSQLTEVSRHVKKGTDSK